MQDVLCRATSFFLVGATPLLVYGNYLSIPPRNHCSQSQTFWIYHQPNLLTSKQPTSGPCMLAITLSIISTHYHTSGGVVVYASSSSEEAPGSFPVLETTHWSGAC
jgi:hypothetical protein